MVRNQIITTVCIIAALIAVALYFGERYQQAFAFAEARSIEHGRDLAPIRCNFKTLSSGDNAEGTVYVYRGLMRFDITYEKEGIESSLKVVLDLKDESRIQASAPPGNEFVGVAAYPQLVTNIYRDLNAALRSEYLHCTPWLIPDRLLFGIHPTEE